MQNAVLSECGERMREWKSGVWRIVLRRAESRSRIGVVWWGLWEVVVVLDGVEVLVWSGSREWCSQWMDEVVSVVQIVG